jgi:tetratricopeptide (TPR) repeat protein
MAKSNRTSTRPYSLDPFDDRVDTLFAELELAVKWERPSILLAVYKSEFVQADIERLLNARLAEIGIKVVRILVNENQFDIPLQLIKQPDLEKTVFFISGLKWGGGRSGRNAYRALNIRREYLVDYKIRAIFWLTEDESAELPFRAPDFWSFRHRVIEFIDTPPILYSAKIDGSEPARNFFTIPEDIDKKIEAQEALVNWLPDGAEAVAEFSPPFFDLGNLYWLKGELGKAAETISAAISLARTAASTDLQFRALIGLGVLNSDACLLSEAVSAFQRASRIDPQSFIPWLYLGIVYSRLGLSRRSLFAIRKASRLNPRSAEAWLALGNLYAERDNFSEALAAYQASLALEKNNPRAWESLGKIYHGAGDLAAAISAYEKSIRLEPENGETLGKLSLLYRDSGELQKAYKLAKKAVRKAPRVAKNWIIYGSISAAQGHYDDAILAFSQAAKIDLDNPLSAISLADCFLKQGNTEQFNHWYSLASILSLEGDDYVKACFYALTKDSDASLKYLKSALKRKQVDAAWLQRDPIFEFMREGDVFQHLLRV